MGSENIIFEFAAIVVGAGLVGQGGPAYLFAAAEQHISSALTGMLVVLTARRLGVRRRFAWWCGLAYGLYTYVQGGEQDADQLASRFCTAATMIDNLASGYGMSTRRHQSDTNFALWCRRCRRLILTVTASVICGTAHQM